MILDTILLLVYLSHRSGLLFCIFEHQDVLDHPHEHLSQEWPLYVSLPVTFHALQKQQNLVNRVTNNTNYYAVAQNSTTILDFRVTHPVVDELHPFVCA